MSGIYGIFNLEGQAVSPGDLERMKAPMSYWGPDGQGTWREGTVGLGQLMLHNTPESIHETLPLKSGCGRYVITAAARIDNRDELLKTFDIPLAEHPVTPDGALILKAYQKWGEQCTGHLLGDWAFALWDVRERELFMARDHHGNTSLYYFRSPRFFAFSSCLKGLLALPGIPADIDEIPVAQLLVSWPRYGFPTVYKNISRLPPAHWMRVKKEGVRTRRYWRLEDTPRLVLKSDGDYIDAFLEIYSEAVRCRLRSLRPVGTTLSGGLDSGSVAALAAREMAQEGRRLQAFASVPLYDTEGCVGRRRFGDETPYIKATAEHAGNIDVHFIRAEHVSPLKGIQRSLSLHDEPWKAAANSYWIIALLEEARNRGMGTLLTGQGGNGTVSWKGSGYLGRLAWHLHWKTLLKELRAWGNIHGKTVWRAFLRQVVRPFVLAPVKQRIKRFSNGGPDPWRDYSAINPDFALRLGLREKMYRSGFDPAFGIKADTREMRFRVIKPGRCISGCLWGELGAGFAMEVRDPTVDKRVMEFCLAIPDNQYLRDGRDRFLMRRSMETILPDNVRLNTLKGTQAADIEARVNAGLDELKSTLRRVEKSPAAREYLDIKMLNHILAMLEKKIGGIHLKEVKTILLRGLMTGMFLQGVDEHSPHRYRD
ncbi:MAG: asparagine synthetase B [bacterium]|nr:asparagine synthetase B [bacterium]